MLKIFLSSTFRDLKEYRQNILKKLNDIFCGIGMETFVPSGEDSHKICLENIDDSDIIIFLITPYYGSLIDRCNSEDCSAKCPMKQQSDEKISYTHCEYKYALSKEKKHMTYLVDDERNLWDLVYELSKITDINEIKKSSIKDKLSKFGSISYFHYHKIANQVLSFKREIEKNELVQKIAFNDVNKITSDLYSNIINWYEKEEIVFNNFCGRKKKLVEVLSKIGQSVEIYGVGGIGKSSLIQVALILCKLRGWNIISIGQKQAYISGSGYHQYKQKPYYNHHYFLGSSFNLNDILDSLNLSKSKKLDEKEKIDVINSRLKDDKILLFIDDFHLAEENLHRLVCNTDNIIIASRSKHSIARNEIPLQGLSDAERYDLINLTSKNFNVELTDNARNKISSITEGHPIAIEILIRNYQRIDFDICEKYKQMLDFTKVEHVEEFLNRVIRDILTTISFSLLEDMSVFNTKIVTNINKTVLAQSHGLIDFNNSFNDLLDSGFVTKKTNSENLYRFTYHHIQQTLYDLECTKCHESAIRYYKKKQNTKNFNLDDKVEILFHEASLKFAPQQIEDFKSYSKIITPNKDSLDTLIESGKKLLPKTENREKGIISGFLGQLYSRANNFSESEFHFYKATEMFENSFYMDEVRREIDIAQTLADYSSILRKNKEFQKALNIAQQSLDKLPPSPLLNNQELNYIRAIIYTNLGNINHGLKNNEEALAKHKKALIYYKKSPQKNKSAYKSRLAIAHNNLGNVLSDLGDLDRAKDEHGKSLKIKRDLYLKKPDLYKETYLSSLINSAVFYHRIKEIEKSSSVSEESLIIGRELIEKNPVAFGSIYLTLLSNLIVIFHNTGKVDKSIDIGYEAIRFVNNSQEQNRLTYQRDLALIMKNLAVSHKTLSQFNKTEELLLSALEIYENFDEEKIRAFFGDFLKTKSNLAELYISTKRVNKGVLMLENIIDKYLVQLDDGGIPSKIALANGYAKQNRLKDSIIIYFESFKFHFKRFTKGIHSQKDMISSLNQIINISDGNLKEDTKVVKNVILSYMKTDLEPIDVNLLSSTGGSLWEIIKQRLSENDAKKDNEIDKYIFGIIEFHSKKKK